MTMLGIDYGTKRVGIAYSDKTNTVGLPLAVIPNDAELFDAIQRVAAEKEASAVVVGESKSHRGEDNPIMEDIRRFAKELEEKIALPVHFEPEFMSSMQAERFQGKTATLDASAAAIILQSYLDRQKNDISD